ncbi:TPA: hypothetical protein ACNABU_003882 [Citrobacter amalonaticus]
MSNKYEDIIKSAGVNADCGEHMSPAEVTALLNVVEATFAALAAENACLKQSIEEVAEAFETGTDGVLATAVDESLNLLTPETDAVLKRIQAQGVAMFASKCKEESIRAHSSDARDSWWVSGENADDFAAQLRQEAAQ